MTKSKKYTYLDFAKNNVSFVMKKMTNEKSKLVKAKKTKVK